MLPPDAYQDENTTFISIGFIGCLFFILVLWPVSLFISSLFSFLFFSFSSLFSFLFWLAYMRGQIYVPPSSRFYPNYAFPLLPPPRNNNFRTETSTQKSNHQPTNQRPFSKKL
jgi:hypothetical protein